MDLYQMTIKMPALAAPAVENLLMEADFDGLQWQDDYAMKQVAVTVYATTKQTLQTKSTILQPQIDRLLEFGINPHPFKIEIKPVNGKWKTNWEASYQAERITRFLTIAPTWSDYEPMPNSDERVIRLDPGMSFGTGTHPTTKLALQALETVLRGQETVFDVGCGSGVLSIAARSLGALQIVAGDNDPIAVAATQRNFANNPVMKLNHQVKQQSLLTEQDQLADVIVANMLAEVLLLLIPQVNDHLTATGKFILAGIYVDQLAKVTNALNQQHLKIEQTLTRGKWYALIASKEQR
ncbi:50S ribosomal protein L11 methyltransferase [Fructilactobacillus florum]|nr:50S ribosomal protein L11 methyltransferase [Fructilactobacillus florum]